MRALITLATPAQYTQCEIEPKFTVNFQTRALTGFKRFFDPIANDFTQSRPWALDGEQRYLDEYHGILISIIDALLGTGALPRTLGPQISVDLASRTVSGMLSWAGPSGTVDGAFTISPPLQVLGAAAQLVVQYVQAQDQSLAGTVALV